MKFHSQAPKLIVLWFPVPFSFSLSFNSLIKYPLLPFTSEHRMFSLLVFVCTGRSEGEKDVCFSDRVDRNRWWWWCLFRLSLQTKSTWSSEEAIQREKRTRNGRDERYEMVKVKLILATVTLYSSPPLFVVKVIRFGKCTQTAQVRDGRKERTGKGETG